MREKDITKLIGSTSSPYALLNSLLMASANREANLTPEEKAKRTERKEQRRLLQEERIRQAKIIKNICPDCTGKLIRGKKDKKNDYKRTWSCKDCGESHTM